MRRRSAPRSDGAVPTRAGQGVAALAISGAAVQLSVAVEAGEWPGEAELTVLAEEAVAAATAELGLMPPEACELGLIFTDDARIRALNARWRGKDRPTNVLSFPAFPVGRGAALPPMLGDIVLAFETVSREAREEGKPFRNHLTHLIVHGFLHLVGFDHEIDDEAEAMEAAERRILSALAIPDPYA